MDFLEYLADLAGCCYLSDLRHAAISPEQAAALRALPDGQFPMEDYRRAVNYLLEQPADCSSPAAARALLADYLLEKAQ